MWQIKQLIISLFLVSSSLGALASEARNCETCTKVAKNSCSLCRSVFYCNASCQKKGWVKHKKECAELAYRKAKEYDAVDNLSKAFKFYTKSAKKKHPKAIHDLACFFLEGEAVEKNEAEALKLFVQSANLGFPKAMTALSIIYLKKGDHRSSTYWQHKATQENRNHDSEEQSIVKTAREIVFKNLQDNIGPVTIKSVRTSEVIVPGLSINPIRVDPETSESFVTEETSFTANLNEFGKVLS